MDQSELYAKIYEVMTNQPFGILSTVENGVPHSSIVAFSITNNLRTILFLTEQNSKKFKNISGNPAVSILVDVRPSLSKDISGSFAVSANGNAKPVDLKSSNATKELFLFCHPSFIEYVENASYSLMSISVNKYDVSNGINDVYTYKFGA